MTFDSYLETLDLQAVHVFLSIAGVVLSTHLMQLAWHNPEECGMPLRLLRRANLGLVAFGMLWSLSYAADHGWQPWPPALLMLLAVNVMMGLRIFIIHRVRHRRQQMRTLYRADHRLQQRRTG